MHPVAIVHHNPAEVFPPYVRYATPRVVLARVWRMSQ
jgi:hypothetical protein